MKIKISLIMVSLDLQTGQDFLVSNNQDKCELPSLEYSSDKGNIESVLETLHNQFLELDIDWTEPVLLTVQDENHILNIYYSCLVPLDIDLKCGYFIQCPKSTIINAALRRHTYK